MKSSVRLAVPFAAMLGGCGGTPDDSGAVAGDECGDVDGDGTDTGNVPDLAGSWSTSFAQDFYDDSCSASDLSQTSETWIAAMQVQGSVPSLAMQFGVSGSSDERFYGMVDRNGGVTFAGTHAHPSGTLYTQFGGLVYHDQYLDHDVIDGSAFLGLDADGDGVIDCAAKGSWRAIKSE